MATPSFNFATGTITHNGTPHDFSGKYCELKASVGPIGGVTYSVTEHTSLPSSYMVVYQTEYGFGTGPAASKVPILKFGTIKDRQNKDRISFIIGTDDLRAEINNYLSETNFKIETNSGIILKKESNVLRVWFGVEL